MKNRFLSGIALASLLGLSSVVQANEIASDILAGSAVGTMAAALVLIGISEPFYGPMPNDAPTTVDEVFAGIGAGIMIIASFQKSAAVGIASLVSCLFVAFKGAQYIDAMNNKKTEPKQIA